MDLLIFIMMIYVLPVSIISLLVVLGYILAQDLFHRYQNSKSKKAFVFPTVATKEKVEMHSSTFNRIKQHEALYKRLWKESVDFSEDKDFLPTEILALPNLIENVTSTPSDDRDEEVIILKDLSQTFSSRKDGIETSQKANHVCDKASSGTLIPIERVTPDVSEIHKNVEPNLKSSSINRLAKKSKNQVKHSKMKQKETFGEFRNCVAAEARGRWLDIFSLYIDGEVLKTWSSKRNTCCPDCGREKKYYLIDHQTGATHCCAMSCNFHASDGFATISAMTGEKYGKVVRKIAEELGLRKKSGMKICQKKQFKKTPPARTEMSKSERRYYEFILNKSKKLKSHFLQFRYLLYRGIPKSVVERCANHLYGMYSLNYIDDSGNSGKYPVLVLPIHKDGKQIGFHRIYLKHDGTNLPFEESKKPTPNYPLAYSGARIELGGSFKDGICYIAEGVETALAVTALFQHTCWSTMNAAGIQTFVPPLGCQKVVVYADLDASKGGEVAALKLQERLLEINISCEIRFPPASLWNKSIKPKGIDWLDVLNINIKKESEVNELA